MAKAIASKPAKRLPWRHIEYSEELVDSIFAKLADGESLRRICAAADMPSREAVTQWIDKTPGVLAKYARAREEQAEFHHDEMDKIEADVLSGELQPQAANVVLQNKRWRMEKLKPKVYGVAVTLKGDPDNPIECRSNMTDTQLETLALTGRASG